MTQTPMIKHLARAMVEDFDALPATEQVRDETSSSYLLSQETVVAMAKAVLTALLDPTPEMVEAGAHKLGDGYADDDDRFWARAVFTAMIKAIQEGE